MLCLLVGLLFTDLQYHRALSKMKSRNIKGLNWEMLGEGVTNNCYGKDYLIRLREIDRAIIFLFVYLMFNILNFTYF